MRAIATVTLLQGRDSPGRSVASTTSATTRRETDHDAQQRLSLLAELGVLDTDPEPGFDALTHAAAKLTQCPIALISLVDGGRQWFKARVGLNDLQTPSEWPFCAYAIDTPDLMEVRDATADVRFAGNPLVIGIPGIRFYAGQPLTVDAIRIGTLCVIDTKPRQLSLEAADALLDLGAAVSAMLAERRKRVASAEQQHRLAEFAMVAGDWLWETDAEHRIVWSSSAYGTPAGMPAPWLLGQPMADGPVLESHDALVTPQTTLHRLLDQKRGFARALVRCDVGGESRYLSHSAVSRRESTGRWNGYRGITRDLTARVAAELSLRVSANLLVDLSAQVPGVIFQLRLNGGRLRFPYVSNRVSDVCELSPAQLMADARAALARCHPDDAPRVMQSLHRSARALSVWQETFRVVLPVAGERTLLVHAEPRRIERDGVLWHGLLTDVTEQVRADKHLQLLTLSQVAAERAVEVRTEFMSRVSHELRTPLNAILGFAQVLRLTNLSQSRADMLQSVLHIETAGAHLLALINDLLDLSGLDTDGLVLSLHPVALAPLIERCVALMEPAASERRIILDTQVENELPTVLANVRAVKQLVFNLVGNAIKFADSGSVVRVRVRRAGADVALAVSDQGPGIAADKLASIFEPFMRIDDSVEAPQGSGLGLSISQRLASAMAGRIAVSSDFEGTTFTVTLPADGGPEITEADDSAFGRFDAFLSTDGMGRGSVLYIEDEPVNVLLMQAVFDTLPETGPRLTIASDGAGGLSEAARLVPDLILLDMNLSDMVGLAILRLLRDDARTASIPVIVVSADALPEQIRKARDAGCQDYWTKPLDLNLVYAELLRRFPVVRPAAGAPV